MGPMRRGPTVCSTKNVVDDVFNVASGADDASNLVLDLVYHLLKILNKAVLFIHSHESMFGVRILNFLFDVFDFFQNPLDPFFHNCFGFFVHWHGADLLDQMTNRHQRNFPDIFASLH